MSNKTKRTVVNRHVICVWVVFLLGPALAVGARQAWSNGDPSLVGWWTFDEGDGSEVLIIYQADRTEPLYPDCARPGREGARGILNAFELIQVGPLTSEYKLALSK